MPNKEIEKIGIIFNLKKADILDDRQEEYDDKETIEAIKLEIENLGFKVILYEQDQDLIDKLYKNRPDFVLNIAEGIGNTRARESQVPCILETLNIPYSGSDPVVLGLTLDKYFTNRLLSSSEIPVPIMYMIKHGKEITDLEDIFKNKKQFIVKPRWEGSSKGVFLNSVVSNYKDLKDRVKSVLSVYHQPAVIEEYLVNEEITVGVCGNNSPFILGMLKILPKDNDQKKFLYSLEIKRDWKNQVVYESQKSISEITKLLVKEFAIKAFKALEIRDVARIDFRLDSENNPKIIDINPLPGLSPHYSDLPILYRLKGKTYSDLIKVILQESFKRLSFNWGINLLKE